MDLGTNRELAENKLILLHIINSIGMPVSNQQITKIILENKFMNYFLLQQYLDELCESHHIESNLIDDKTFYSITEYGKQTLNYFGHIIPPGIKGRIDNSLLSYRNKVRNETSVSADYIPVSDNEFVVTCKIHEGSFSLIDLKITVGTKSDAKAICDNWKKNSQAIYSEIIESLTRKRP